MWFDFRKEDAGFVDRAPVVHVAEATLAAPRAAVFAALVRPDDWKRWFPGVQDAWYEGPPPYGPGTIRHARVGGTHWVEELVAWDEDTRWAFTVTHATAPFAHAQVEHFDVLDDPAGTRVRWRLALEPRLAARLGGPLTPIVIRRLLRRAMANLDARLAAPSRG